MTMHAGSHEFLCRLIGMGTSSLLQYISESSPWSASAADATLAAVVSLASEERAETTRFVRWLQKQRQRLPRIGSFPSHFTTMNFVTLDYLLPKLIAEHAKEIAEIEGHLGQLDDAEIRALTQGYLEMKKRHLQTLKELTPALSAV